MNQTGQKTHLKLACSNFLPPCSPSPVRSPPRSLEPASLLLCNQSSLQKKKKKKPPPRFYLPSLFFFLSKPSPTFLFMHQQVWFPHHQHGPAMPMQPLSREKRGPLYFKKEMQRKAQNSLLGAPHKRGLHYSITPGSLIIMLGLVFVNII